MLFQNFLGQNPSNGILNIIHDSGCRVNMVVFIALGLEDSCLD